MAATGLLWASSGAVHPLRCNHATRRDWLNKQYFVSSGFDNLEQAEAYAKAQQNKGIVATAMMRPRHVDDGRRVEMYPVVVTEE